MELELTISERAAEWLEQKAQAAGTDEATVAASVLNNLAEQELGSNGAAAEDRLRFFREWVAAIPPRPGPAVDASRDSIHN
jgi:hypothetical protein